MLSSMSYKSLSIAVAALGFTNIAPPDGGARGPASQLAVVRPVAAPVDLAASGRSLTLTKASDGLFYVTAAVNDVPVRFVVDTGANVVVLTRRDAQAVGVTTTRGTGQTLRTAGGRQAMRWTSIERLKIAGHTVDNTDAVVVADNGPPHSLLGQSALARFRSVTLRGDRLDLQL
ncbi:TIGR02281 family clan AA aspartic protease [Sphingomonas sp. KR1UV-12]|uniref:TIGR02281 family clan AA aspartic protease n=1 Tax=Sphingomonas aurea TaxID=3063994 RepID=A0ABT9EJK3_9SPHN|nr:TIGR02281 family clan AA aspartic protease [Sphingomonas sp. KR1UV-12]MDP1027152.1 TIGR02281 family clan AA aspartic protease [Sphingomonas sp. KR1UV-12]